MKKFLLPMLALALLCLPAAALQAQADEPGPIDYSVEVAEDAGYRAEVAQDAGELLRLFARVMQGAQGFDGAPDADLAWRALSAYANETAGDGQVFDAEDMESMYEGLFAYGTFADIAGATGATGAAGGQFSAVDGGYQFAAADGEAAFELALSSTDGYEGGVVLAELSVWTLAHGDYPQTFSGNARAALVPSPLTAFGARVGGWNPLELPVFGGASATATLDPQEGNTYAAANATDGKLETCWAYTASKADAPSLTLSAEATQTVRGLTITPGYAKSAYAFSSNRRAASLRVALSDGTQFTFDLPDVDKQDYEGTYVLPFGGAYETGTVTLEVTSSYDGTHFDDVCISEVVIF